MFVKYNIHCRLCIAVLLSVDRAVRGWNNVVGIAALYGLDGLGSNPGRGKIFAALQTGPGAHQVACTMGTCSVFPGLKRPGR